MPPAIWPLRDWRPSIPVTLSRGKGKRIRHLVADTGAGSDQAIFELLLRETDCRESSVKAIGQAKLGGAYTGWFNVYTIEVRIPKLKFFDSVAVLGVPEVPYGFDGIACFKFLNRFHYGNFGDTHSFGLE